MDVLETYGEVGIDGGYTFIRSTMRERGTAIAATVVMEGCLVKMPRWLTRCPPSEVEHPLAAWPEYPIGLVLLSISVTSAAIWLEFSYYVERLIATIPYQLMEYISLCAVGNWPLAEWLWRYFCAH
jgi:hypothetical protein